MKMKKQRKVVIALLLVLALLVTGFTYAYWASGITVTQGAVRTPTVTIGEGQSVATTVTVSDPANNTVKLVPSTITPSAGEANSVTYTFNVEWAGSTHAASTVGATADLSLTATLNTPAGLTADKMAAMFTISNDLSVAEMTYGQTKVVNVTVTFANEPANAVDYEAIINQVLTLTVTFTLGPVTPA